MTLPSSRPQSESRPHPGLVRAPQALAAGLGLVALGAFGVWAAGDLEQGSLRAIGPGLLPHWLAIGVGICGLALVAAGFLHEGAPLSAFSWRGPLVVSLALFAFALTIRPVALGPVTTPGLGLIVAGPLAVIVGGYASPEARFSELVTLALLLTAGCMLLFGDFLNLPIPIFPKAVVEALTGILPARVTLRIGAGALALAGLALLFAQQIAKRRAARRQPDAAQPAPTA